MKSVSLDLIYLDDAEVSKDKALGLMWKVEF